MGTNRENNLGALWKNKGKDYLNGSLDIETLKRAAKSAVNGKINIKVFKNTFKKEDKHPDFNILLSTAKKKEESSGFLD